MEVQYTTNLGWSSIANRVNLIIGSTWPPPQVTFGCYCILQYTSLRYCWSTFLQIIWSGRCFVMWCWQSSAWRPSPMPLGTTTGTRCMLVSSAACTMYRSNCIVCVCTTLPLFSLPLAHLRWPSSLGSVTSAVTCTCTCSVCVWVFVCLSHLYM